MPKRFTDSDKWADDFVRSLDYSYKLFWVYLLDACDHAGFWKVELDIAEVRIGVKLDYETAMERFRNKVAEIEPGKKWFIPKFAEFQYGDLSLSDEKKSRSNIIISVRQKMYQNGIDPDNILDSVCIIDE